MRKVKLIVHEKNAGKQKPSDIFAAVFLSDTAALTLGESPNIMKLTDQSQGSLCSGKGVSDGTSEA